MRDIGVKVVVVIEYQGWTSGYGDPIALPPECSVKALSDLCTMGSMRTGCHMHLDRRLS